jgi:hypothetical protein
MHASAFSALHRISFLSAIAQKVMASNCDAGVTLAAHGIDAIRVDRWICSVAMRIRQHQASPGHPINMRFLAGTRKTMLFCWAFGSALTFQQNSSANF